MVKKEILALLKSAGVKATEQQIERPPSSDFGDFSFPCFPLAKEMRKSPVQIAEEIAKKIKVKKNSLVEKVESKSGYVNFFFNYSKFAKIVLDDVEEKVNVGKGEKVMIEYSSPNPVHPMHIGSSRNTFLGDSLANILEFTGSKVIRANYINNVGLQVAKLVTAYSMWSDGGLPKGAKPDMWLWKYYVRFHDEAKTDPSLEEKAKETLRKYELDGDRQTKDLWDKVVKWCIDGFKDTYSRVGVEFDEYFYEDQFRKSGKDIVKKAMKDGFASKTDDGAVLADLNNYGLSATIIQRSDGTGLYITSDLGLTSHKFSKYKLDKSIWVAGAPQELHFKQLFKILELTGHKFAKDCHHLSYEIVSLLEGKMSSREGKAVMLDEVLEKLTNLAYVEVDKRNADMDEETKREIANDIAVSALKYGIVRIEPNKQITFDWDQMLRLDGNTGPYVQYAYTRCSSMLKKAGKFSRLKTADEMSDDEKKLIRSIYEFQNVVSQSALEMKPHLICNYVYDLATTFNSFYQSVPVIKTEDEGQRNFRLTLVESTASVIKACLGLIGIRVPEKM